MKRVELYYKGKGASVRVDEAQAEALKAKGWTEKKETKGAK